MRDSYHIRAMRDSYHIMRAISRIHVEGEIALPVHTRCVWSQEGV